MARIAHIAIVDDWEAADRFGEYEVATRGVSLEVAGFVCAVALTGVRRVLDKHYADIRYDLVLVVLDAEALATQGLEVVENASGGFRVLGPIQTHGEAVVEVLPIGRVSGDFAIPDLSRFDVVAGP